ncbi:MAG: AMP-binding protein [Pseudomonadota bacterium]
MIKSGHVDTFARDNLPPLKAWPDFIGLEDLAYPDRLNVATELIDRHVLEGRGDRIALLGDGVAWTFETLAKIVNKLANLLVANGLVPGNRVLLRSANSPMMAAFYFAILKAGGVVVATMPLLRAKELGTMLDKAKVGLAVCDAKLSAEMVTAATSRGTKVIHFGIPAFEGELASHSDAFTACDTANDDVCLIGFTSGTTGVPKGTMHFHRDVLAICDCYGAKVLRASPDDRFIGSPPLAFTFGLGGLVLFPWRIGAAAILLEKVAPDDLLPAIAVFKATVLFTAPTAYRAMLSAMDHHDTGSLRICVSAGEALPRATFDAFKAKTGITILDGIGATEMLHIFIGAPLEKVRPGATGLPVPPYQARVIDADGHECPAGTPGRLAVRGPTGCRYLADPRQAEYVQNGWNITGDTYIRDSEGYFWYQARSDDMIISAGYNIAGPEVEAGLLTHPSVAEAGVVAAPDPERGQIAKAYVVLAEGVAPEPSLVRTLQDHVKAQVAPYKYPRAIAFVDALPRTETGKLQRFALRQRASAEAAA